MLKNCLSRVYYFMGNLPEAYNYSQASLELAPEGDLVIEANAQRDKVIHARGRRGANGGQQLARGPAGGGYSVDGRRSTVDWFALTVDR